ncbi:DNA-binding transcriptional regulator Fis [Halomonas sp. NO4]|uniref:DNA-binding transcriptional regulator Fis n=1 Tax=Halomonas sp. NO4 TaxID=2484813 RepID=UPI001F08DDBC|nr:DNA-binding transcriptional regulator Fis [Halomonas sp. NO4]
MNRHPIERSISPSLEDDQAAAGLATPGDTANSLAEEPATLGERPLREAVDAAMRRYFDHLDGGIVTDLYSMVMAEVESPLLAAVLDYTQGNQTRAAEILGLNRGTLRKKLKQHDLI